MDADKEIRIKSFYDKIILLNKTKKELVLDNVINATQAYIAQYRKCRGIQHDALKSEYQAIAIIHSLANWQVMSGKIKRDFSLSTTREGNKDYEQQYQTALRKFEMFKLAQQYCDDKFKIEDEYLAILAEKVSGLCRTDLLADEMTVLEKTRNCRPPALLSHPIFTLIEPLLPAIFLSSMLALVY